jgi:hypothetical protein
MLPEFFAKSLFERRMTLPVEVAGREIPDSKGDAKGAGASQAVKHGVQEKVNFSRVDTRVL